MRIILLASITLAIPGSAVAQPAMNRAEMTQLYEAAGFPIRNNRPTNSCGTAAVPTTSFVDINGDRVKEALFVDRNPACYRPTGRYFALMTRSGAGWRALITGNGTILARPTNTGGWLDMSVTNGGAAQIYRYNGSQYVSGAVRPGRPGVAAPAVAARPTPAPAAAVAGRGPAANWKLPKAASTLTVAEREALFRAGNFVKRGNAWKGCDGESDASISDETMDGGVIRDLNGDGMAEVIVTDSGTACYGMTGTGFQIMTATPTGWKSFWESPGIPTVKSARGPGGWPEIELGGPGFCFPVYAWDGKSYDIKYFNEYDAGACRRQEVPARYPVRKAG
jgi:hypothetical protein